MRVEGLESDTEYLVLVAVGNVVGESGTVKFNVQTTKFHEGRKYKIFLLAYLFISINKSNYFI